MTKPRRLLELLAVPLLAIPVVAVALLSAPLLAAESYPARPIRIVVPYPPGGSTDVLVRIVAQKMSETMEQSVVVENKPGGNAVIAYDYVAKAAPDGYTLLMTYDPPHTSFPTILKKLSFDAVKDFVPITMVAKTPQALVVNASLPVNSLKEFIDYAKANPGKVFAGTPGTGTAQHFAMELLNQTAGIKIMHVPYKGGQPALADVLGGRLQAGFLTLVTAHPQLKARTIKALGVPASARAQSAPEVPTFTEAGLAEYAMPDLWIGLIGPAGLPPAIVARLRAEVAKATSVPAVRTKLEELGFELIVNSPAEMAATINRNVEVYRRIASKAGIQPE